VGRGIGTKKGSWSSNKNWRVNVQIRKIYWTRKGIRMKKKDKRRKKSKAGQGEEFKTKKQW
jgi:hypothetical protein